MALINLHEYPVRGVLHILLQDKTTKQNIIWATDAYSSFGQLDRHQITVDALLGMSPVTIQPRCLKSLEDQQQRTRKKAEVFTPVWLCNQMNNHCDAEWFGRENVFNRECGHTWDVTDDKIQFPKGKRWQRYVDSRRLEITCGEAPFLVSRYDMATGELIVPPFRRIGILDRKLRVVDENTDTKEEWLKWALRAFQSVYGYEYQGDSLLIARINLLLTFVDYYNYRWDKDPDGKTLKKLSNIIAWNLWQMDGLKDTVPLGSPYVEHRQLTIFDFLETQEEKKDVALPCKIFDWRAKRSLLFKDLKGDKR